MRWSDFIASTEPAALGAEDRKRVLQERSDLFEP